MKIIQAVIERFEDDSNLWFDSSTKCKLETALYCQSEKKGTYYVFDRWMLDNFEDDFDFSPLWRTLNHNHLALVTGEDLLKQAVDTLFDLSLIHI